MAVARFLHILAIDRRQRKDPREGACAFGGLIGLAGMRATMSALGRQRRIANKGVVVLYLTSGVTIMTLSALTTAGIQLGAVLAFAFEWLLAGILGSLLYLALIRFVYRRRRGSRPDHR